MHFERKKPVLLYVLALADDLEARFQFGTSAGGSANSQARNLFNICCAVRLLYSSTLGQVLPSGWRLKWRDLAR